MKICAIICEFNPFHNGHKYILDKARELSGCDALICIMSGSFTQRGDICIADKYTRARHAVDGGADCVLELPTAFSVAPAEIFAKGAVKILSSVPEIDTLAFGCESGFEADFLSAAKILSDESGKFKEALNKSLDAGESYAKSYAAAFEVAGGAEGFLSTPNNILGVEYAKAVLGSKKNIRLLPVRRVGAGFNDGEIKQNFSSATAIRKNLSSPLVKGNVPDFVAGDLTDFSVENGRFEDYLRLILSRTSAEALKPIYGCGDGLENALKSLQALP
ncbi:MAG: nucleotidyltransferase family protein, partial [Clostridia bacterium]|nr:nucleotidyltransferase family protein [Clostridia bacterium]